MGRRRSRFSGPSAERTDLLKKRKKVSLNKNARQHRSAPGALTFLQSSLVEEALQGQYASQYCAKNVHIASLIISVGVTAIVTVLVASSESFTEVVIVLILAAVVALVSEVAVLIGKRVLIAEAPSVLTVCLTGIKAFAITQPNRLLKHVSSVLIYFVPPATAVVPIDRC